MRLSHNGAAGLLFLCAFLAACQLTYAQEPSGKTTGGIRDFFEASKFSGKVRYYYMKRHFDTPKTEESSAIGAHLKYETPSWHNLAAGAAGYTSQPLFTADSDRDGARILAPDQKGYTVLGQAYLKYRIGETSFRLFRQELDTPFLNTYDVKMIPVTVEAYTLQNNNIPHTTLTAAHVTKIKGWDNTKFVSMSKAAGFEDTNEPLTLAGIDFSPNETYKFQLWEYYCYQFMNVLYAQADATWRLGENLSYSLSAQGFHQQDVGRELGGRFHTGMVGVKTGVGFWGAQVNVGYTITRKTHDMVNPWGSYPGYTSIMEEDCDLAGEKAWLLEVLFDFEKVGIKGLSAIFDHTEAYQPETGSFPYSRQHETNLTFDYRFSGRFGRLWLRLRGAFVDDSLDSLGRDYSDHRVILNYDF